MQGNVKIRVGAVILLVLWMSVIFIMSSQPAKESSQSSGEFVSKVIDIIYSDFDTLSLEQQSEITYNITFFVRKSAHFLEYFVLGILSAIVVFTFKESNVFVKTFSAIGFSVFYAISDEVHQYFVPGRACRLLDICIDSLGSIGAIVMVSLIVIVKNKSGEPNA